MLECNKNYVILVLDCMLKNSKETISVLGIKKRDRNNSIKKNIQKYSLVNDFPC